MAHPVDTQRISDLLITAFEGGSNYWIAQIRYDQAPLEVLWRESESYPRYSYYPLNPGGVMSIRTDDDEEQKWHRLDQEVIQRGLDLFPVKAARHFAEWMIENDDATTADVFLQLCLFGEVIYG